MSLVARAFLAALVMALLVAPASAPAVSLPAGTTALLTGGPSLLEALAAPVGTAEITADAVSEDGTYVAFSSYSDGLVDGDDDRVQNVYRKNMTTGEVVLVSRRDGPGGAPSHDYCGSATISDDGSRVAFQCDGPLDAADTNALSDVYVRTPGTNSTKLVSRAPTTGTAGNKESTEPVLSQNGDYVAFTSFATDLVSGVTTEARRVFRTHLPTDFTVVASRKDGLTGAHGDGIEASIDDSGSLIAFASGNQLDTADTNNSYDIYVRDMPAGKTTLVSRATGPDGAVGGGAFESSISGNGLAVVFDSYAPLDGQDKDTASNIYRRSLGLKTTALIDVTGGGAPSGRSWGPSIDDSSHVIAFVSQATALHPDDTDPSADVYVKNIASNKVEVGSRRDGAGGAPANRQAVAAAMSGDAYLVASELDLGGITPDADPRRSGVVLRHLEAKTTRSVARPQGTDPFVNQGGDGSDTALSANGRVAVFRSDAGGLGLPAGSQNGIFVRDRFSGSVTLVSLAGDGQPFTRVSDPAVSADGRRVAFSGAMGQTGPLQVWVRDLAAGTTVLASRADGTEGQTGNGRSRGARLDADGTRVVFRSRASNLSDGDGDELEDVHLRDLETGQTVLVSVGVTGAKGDGRSSEADIDGSGTRVSFRSEAKNLGDGDTDTYADVHLRDLGAGTTSLVSSTPDGTKANESVGGVPTIDDAGNRIVFTSPATNLGDASTGPKVFLRDLAAGTLGIVAKGSRGIISPDGGFVAFMDLASRTLLRDLAQEQAEGVSPAGGQSTLYDISAQGACVTFGSADPIVGPARDSFELYLHAVVADCADPAPVDGAGGPGGDGGPVAVDPGGARRDTVAPVLSNVRLSRRRFRVQRRNARVAARRGTVLRFRSSEAGALTLTIQRLRKGRRARRAGKLTRRIAAGKGSIRITGRIGRRALRRGKYRLRIAATDTAGNRSAVQTRRFRVL